MLRRKNIFPRVGEILKNIFPRWEMKKNPVIARYPEWAIKKTCASVFTFFFISRLGFVLRPLPGPEQAVGDVATHVLRHQRPLPTHRHPLKWKQLYGFLLNSVADLNPTDLYHFPGSGSVSYRFCLYPDPYQSSVWIRIHNKFS